MNNKFPKAVIFDWDNTLVDSWPLIHFAINETMSAMNKELWSFEKVKTEVHKSMRDIFPEMFGSNWLIAAEIYKKSYRSQHLEKIVLLPDALNLINFLYEKNIPLFIISNKTGDVVRIEAENLKIADKFLKIIGSQDTEFDKPHKAPVDFALQDTEISAQKDLIWFVGDTITDMECALHSDCQPILYGENLNVPEDFMIREKNKTEKPLMYFKSHEEILRKVESLH